MEKERDSFLFYRSYWKSVKHLKPTEREKVLSAILGFMFDGEEVKLKDNTPAMAIWEIIYPLLSKNKENYINGSKGGRPKKETQLKPLVIENKNQTETEPKPNTNPMNNELGIMNKDKGIKNKESKKKVKHTHGIYKHVRLTDDEFERLQNDFPFYQDLIEILDEYIEVSGKSYKNHSIVLRKWVLDKYHEEQRKKDEEFIVKAWEQPKKESKPKQSDISDVEIEKMLEGIS